MADPHAANLTYRTQGEPVAPQHRPSATNPDGSTSDAVRAQAGEIWGEAKQKARSALDDQQKSAAEGIQDFAGALRTAAHDLEGKDKTTVAHMSERAADGLERLAGTLRNKDAGTLVRDLESFARQQPAVFLGAAVALGFLAMRFLKSSSEHDDHRTADYAAGDQGAANAGAVHEGRMAYQTAGSAHEPMETSTSTQSQY